MIPRSGRWTFGFGGCVELRHLRWRGGNQSFDLVIGHPATRLAGEGDVNPAVAAADDTATVSYTHLTLPTNREV